MPPSGFSDTSVKGLGQFLRGCFDDLMMEVHSGKHASLHAGLVFEIGQIESAYSQAERDDERASLLLVKQVYGDALSGLNNDSKNDEAVQKAVDDCVHRISRLHITPDGHLTKRDP